MNSCDRYQELISRLVDGEISREEHAALMAHMNSCSRCNAMYAVFHDLSALLSDEAEPVPEALHENIMAGVRRSAMLQKNRRLRRFGLRTAISAAACAVLVLFAATGFDPGERAGSVSVRGDEAAQLLLTPAPEYAPAASGAPAAEQPVSVPAAPDVYLASGGANDDTARTQPSRNDTQPSQYNSSDYAQNTQQAQYNYSNYAQNTQPTQYDYSTYAQQAQYDVYAQYAQPTPNSAPADFQTPRPAANDASADAQSTPSMRKAAPVSEALLPDDTPLLSDAETFDAPPPEQSEEAASDSVEAPSLRRGVTEEPFAVETSPGDALTLFSLPAEPSESPDAPAGDWLSESKPETAGDAEALFGDLNVAEALPSDTAFFMAPPAAFEQIPAQTETLDIYGKENRDKLLAMIGHSEAELPAEAELTRLVQINLVPEDAYGSAEKLEVRIYGDFVFCCYYPLDGGALVYRADCSLKALDSFLDDCLASAPTPSPSPTPDPFADVAEAEPIPEPEAANS